MSFNNDNLFIKIYTLDIRQKLINKKTFYIINVCLCNKKNLYLQK